MATSVATEAEWLISTATTRRAVWSAVAVFGFGAAAVAAVADAVRAPNVPSIVLAVIVVSLLAMAVVLAAEAVASGIVQVSSAGYAMLGRRRPWSDVLALGTGRIEGRDAAVVAVRGEADDPVDQDVLAGFTEAETERVVATLRARAGALPGFAEVVVPADWWAHAEAEADRAAAVVVATSGREPLARQRVPFGFGTLVDTVRLDYGVTPSGEEVALYARHGLVLGVVAQGRRWLRQTKKRRSVDPATQVGRLFEDHTVRVVPGRAGGFDRLVVETADGAKLVFNAEEPDRF
ncbi:hypothetical protein PCC79_09855 [Propioniciclava soli]|uniref:Uncharacterized protein n=1 Tax=Propioniciclava soli TaxID=2775081 RepID=A0ABZ3C2W9_9ACTN